MVIDLYHGDKNACGAITSGGTESIVLAILAYRNYARETKGITNPNIVVPSSSHCAFDKGCHYLGVKLIKVNSLPDGKCNVNGIKAMVDSNTIMIAGSCPEYAKGIYDPMPVLAAFA